jgi:hypothetical protein
MDWCSSLQDSQDSWDSQDTSNDRHKKRALRLYYTTTYISDQKKQKRVKKKKEYKDYTHRSKTLVHYYSCDLQLLAKTPKRMIQYSRKEHCPYTPNLLS